MNAKQFHNLPHGTKIEIVSRSGDDVAQGAVVTCREYNSRGFIVTFNKVKITAAPADSIWAKYLKRPAQDGFIAEHMTVI